MPSIASSYAPNAPSLSRFLMLCSLMPPGVCSAMRLSKWEASLQCASASFAMPRYVRAVKYDASAIGTP